MRIDEIKILQSVQMEIMDEIHRVCTNNNIRYYLIGGSALGAVRHKGIIPWDVDIDIAMPREDYEKFISTYSKELNSRYSLHYYKTDRNFNSPHVLIVLNDSEVQMFSKDFVRYGIFVDILPLDKCPLTEEENKALYKKILRIKRIKYLKRRKFSDKDNIVKRVIVYFTRTVMSFISLDYLHRKMDRVMQTYKDLENEKDWCSMASHYKYDKLRMPKEYFGIPKLMEFSGRNYFVPEKVHDYLSHLFGNYMEYPSVEQQNAQISSVYYASWYNVEGKKIELGEK